jgi:hypothetical protein
MLARVAGRARYAGSTLSKCLQMLTYTNAHINFYRLDLPTLKLLLSTLISICHHCVSDALRTRLNITRNSHLVSLLVVSKVVAQFSDER